MLIVSFIKLIENVTWLSPIVVVPKKNGKLKICVDFKTLNATIKKDPYLLPFSNEVINIVTKHEIYTFLDGFFWIPLDFHHIKGPIRNRLCYQLGCFCMGCNAFWGQKRTTYLSKGNHQSYS